MDLVSQLSGFPLGVFQLEYTALEDLYLPAYKGSTLRGAFGATFRRIVCLNRKEKNCVQCLLGSRCIYACVFESRRPAQCTRFGGTSEIPRPFVIEPPLNRRSLYLAGENLDFNLILFGKATDYLPYFVFTFTELGKIGLGKGRGKCQLQTVWARQGDRKVPVYSEPEGALKNVPSLEWKHLFDTRVPQGFLELKFLTPTRIRVKNDLVVEPEFHILVRSLIHRITGLAFFHWNKELTYDWKSLIEEAKSIRIRKHTLRWIDWERYSSRQDVKMKMGGFVGRITYQGDFQSFLPLLRLGQYTHMGKNTTFGLGRYEIVKEPNP